MLRETTRSFPTLLASWSAQQQLFRDWPGGRQVFVTERGAPFTRSELAKMIERAGEAAGFHFHMLRHACGYYYANRGEDTRSLQLWLGASTSPGIRCYGLGRQCSLAARRACRP